MKLLFILLFFSISIFPSNTGSPLDWKDAEEKEALQSEARQSLEQFSFYLNSFREYLGLENVGLAPYFATAPLAKNFRAYPIDPVQFTPLFPGRAHPVFRYIELRRQKSTPFSMAHVTAPGDQNPREFYYDYFHERVFHTVNSLNELMGHLENLRENFSQLNPIQAQDISCLSAKNYFEIWKQELKAYAAFRHNFHFYALKFRIHLDAGLREYIEIFEDTFLDEPEGQQLIKYWHSQKNPSLEESSLDFIDPSAEAWQNQLIRLIKFRQFYSVVSVYLGNLLEINKAEEDKKEKQAQARQPKILSKKEKAQFLKEMGFSADKEEVSRESASTSNSHSPAASTGKNHRSEAPLRERPTKKNQAQAAASSSPSSSGLAKKTLEKTSSPEKCVLPTGTRTNKGIENRPLSVVGEVLEQQWNTVLRRPSSASRKRRPATPFARRPLPAEDEAESPIEQRTQHSSEPPALPDTNKGTIEIAPMRQKDDQRYWHTVDLTPSKSFEAGDTKAPTKNHLKTRFQVAVDSGETSSESVSEHLPLPAPAVETQPTNSKASSSSAEYLPEQQAVSVPINVAARTQASVSQQSASVKHDLKPYPVEGIPAPIQWGGNSYAVFPNPLSGIAPDIVFFGTDSANASTSTTYWGTDLLAWQESYHLERYIMPGRYSLFNGPADCYTFPGKKDGSPEVQFLVTKESLVRRQAEEEPLSVTFYPTVLSVPQRFSPQPLIPTRIPFQQIPVGVLTIQDNILLPVAPTQMAILPCYGRVAVVPVDSVRATSSFGLEGALPQNGEYFLAQPNWVGLCTDGIQDYYFVSLEAVLCIRLPSSNTYPYGVKVGN